MAVGGHREVLLYDLETYQVLGALPFPEGEVYTLTFSVNGEVLVAGGGEVGKSGITVAWNVRKAERMGTYGEGYDTILAADISPDHAMVAVGGPSKSVRVFSTHDGTLLYKLDSHTDWIYAIRFSPDGELLATADRAGGLNLWQAANGRPVESLRGHNGAINDLAYSDDSALLASAGQDGTVQVWDTWKYTKVRQFSAHASGVLSVDFAGNGESYGARGFRVRSVEELADAVKQALKEERSTVIDVKVSPKSMTGGYASWWRVGTAEVSRSRAVAAAARKMKAQAARARRY